MTRYLYALYRLYRTIEEAILSNFDLLCSTITTWEKGGEVAAFRNMLEKFPSGPVAVVSDSYNIFDACEKVWGGELKELVVHRGETNGRLVIRPDSGDPVTVVLKVFIEEKSVRWAEIAVQIEGAAWRKAQHTWCSVFFVYIVSFRLFARYWRFWKTSLDPKRTEKDSRSFRPTCVSFKATVSVTNRSATSWRRWKTRTGVRRTSCSEAEELCCRSWIGIHRSALTSAALQWLVGRKWVDFVK